MSHRKSDLGIPRPRKSAKVVLGLVAVGMFETIMGILRTYLFAHTTNRIDVELGARLFRHLLALPIAYFQARRVGDSVARVRELENIRNFLTSSALTLVIDLFFTFVFLAVMFLYSPLLTWIVLASFPLYIGISAGATPLFRRRLDVKFQREISASAWRSRWRSRPGHAGSSVICFRPC
jgi:ATP-binding cassette, subfamily B, bacterial HlyB/CyaB